MIARLSWESSGRRRKSRAKAVTLNQNNTERGGGETVFSGSAGFGDEVTFSQALSNRLQLQPRLGTRHPPHITATPVSGKPSTTPVSTVIGTVASQVGDTRVSDWFRWPY